LKGCHNARNPKHGDTKRRTTTSGSKSRSRATSSKTKSRNLSRTTTDHDEIRHWAEHGGLPACVKGTGNSKDVGMIRIEFPETPNSRDESLQEIGWEEFFQKFDDQRLALVYQEKTSRATKSNFNKLVKRESARSASASR
jgi:hypothetical protein